VQTGAKKHKLLLCVFLKVLIGDDSRQPFEYHYGMYTRLLERFPAAEGWNSDVFQ